MTDRNLLIIYGSQTGTAQELSERIGREGAQRGLLSEVSSMSSYSIEKLSKLWQGPNKAVILVASTTGDGEPPDNMKELWKNFCISRRDLALSGLKFGVIGLGDSSYEKYNYCGKKLHRRLLQLGATHLLDLCLGDDQHEFGYHATVNPWIEQLWQILSQDLGVVFKTSHNGLWTKYLIDSEKVQDGDYYENSEMPGQEEYLREVISNERVTSPSHWQDTRLITISNSYDPINPNHKPGDVLVVQPSNLPGNVEMFFELFPNLINAPPFYVRANPLLPWGKIPFAIMKKLGDQPWSWTHVVTHMLDIQSVPGQYFFERMSFHATDELEKQKLSDFSKPEGLDELYSYCNRPKRTILEVLAQFTSTRKCLPGDVILDIIPSIKPRSFSIASGAKWFPSAIQILVAVVEYQTIIREKRRGLCSNWLAFSCPAGTPIIAWVQNGTFTFPLDIQDATLVMIGPGTGVAPFRSLITQHENIWNKIIFFGSRNEAADYYFKEDWEKITARKHTQGLKVFTAFSRDTDGRKKDYVQDIILQNKKMLKELFDDNHPPYYIYVAGNAKQMPKDVEEALGEVLSNAGIKDAVKYINNLKIKGRYQRETWS